MLILTERQKNEIQTIVELKREADSVKLRSALRQAYPLFIDDQIEAFLEYAQKCANGGDAPAKGFLEKDTYQSSVERLAVNIWKVQFGSQVVTILREGKGMSGVRAWVDNTFPRAAQSQRMLIDQAIREFIDENRAQNGENFFL